MNVALTYLAPGQLSDESLAARVAQGDAAALEALYDRHAAMILGIAYRVTGDRTLAEAVLQETFWQAWQNISAYASGRGAFAGWLLRLARRLALDERQGESGTRDSSGVDHAHPGHRA